jgi:hypothetical protein
VTSQDVVFDEENTWDWNRQQPTQVVFDNDFENEPNLAASMPENSSEVTPIAAEILPTVAETTDAAVQTLHRIRKRPTWMKDYEVTEIDDPITHFAFFFFHIVILQFLKMLSKTQNDGRQ